jgi:hypothetical protein
MAMVRSGLPEGGGTLGMVNGSGQLIGVGPAHGAGSLGFHSPAGYLSARQVQSPASPVRSEEARDFHDAGQAGGLAAKPKFTRDDFIPIARFIADPCVLIVNDQTPYKTLKQFTDDAAKRPNEIIFSSSGLYGALGTRARPLCRSRPRRNAHCASSSPPAAMRHQARAECWRSVSYSAR